MFGKPFLTMVIAATIGAVLGSYLKRYVPGGSG